MLRFDRSTIEVLHVSHVGSLPLIGANPPAKTLKEATREVIRMLGKREFAVPIIQELLPNVGFQLGGKYPRSRLSTTLEDLVKAGEIERAYSGVGSVPHRYRVKESAQGSSGAGANTA